VWSMVDIILSPGLGAGGWRLGRGRPGGAYVMIAPSTMLRPRRSPRPSSVPRGGALRALERQYRVLFKRNPHPMWVFDQKTMRFLEVNEAAVAQYGFSRREFLGMTILDIRPPDHAARVLPFVDMARHGIDVHDNTSLHRRKSGEVFEADVYWNTVRFRGRTAQLVLALDISHRRTVERELQRLREELEQRVVDRTAALEQMNHDLQAEVEERMRLSIQLVQVQEVERRRLARELHDEVGQILTGLKLTLQTLTRDVDGPDAREKLAWSESLVDTLMKQIRELSLTLRPTVHDDLGLLPALLWHVDRYTTQTGVRVAFTHVGIDQRLPPEVETAAFRIVQEALTNVARHAGVAEVKLWVRRAAGELSVVVEDEGRGLPARDASPRLDTGLRGMRERATLLGGALLVETSEAGTRLTAILPAVVPA
jgi:PAS domain S-box-containing protein